ncbi:hypothetical protein LTR56_013465 [Elasticomyces elasticus]|nr:hypothetical protein LTR56_013465 [Elasticomyces elasticus]KAK3652275.1 hypothetical protein LTR22_011777 [Elasticomyces elasticus]KAK4910118.1 hypothetical protein LTR49_021164 [Elasticomyces elasticus]KAK5753925.1 hypothetical protein LTS12_016017 [Elasticomyces elasticus]
MSTSPSKAATPASDAAAVEKSLFTPKEEAVLKVAWACLKSGPPEIDFEKLVKAYGFNTTKTAQNTWGVIKKKLASITPVLEGEEPKTPVKPKAKASPTKKRTKKSEDGDDDDEEKTASPEKKPRKSPVKKTKKSEDGGNDEEEKTESPEKKPRKSPVKKTKKAATPVEDEDETSDVKMKGVEAETE